VPRMDDPKNLFGELVLRRAATASAPHVERLRSIAG
jgi:hypothetical protein